MNYKRIEWATRIRHNFQLHEHVKVIHFFDQGNNMNYMNFRFTSNLQVNKNQGQNNLIDDTI